MLQVSIETIISGLTRQLTAVVAFRFTTFLIHYTAELTRDNSAATASPDGAAMQWL